MVERAVGAPLAHVHASFLSCRPGGTGNGCAAPSALWCLALCVLCSHFCADLLFFVSAWLRITVQSLHSLKGPPIARLSAPFSLPCASAACPLSPCFCSCFLCFLPGSIRVVNDLFYFFAVFALVLLLTCLLLHLLWASVVNRWLPLFSLLFLFACCLLFILLGCLL